MKLKTSAAVIGTLIVTLTTASLRAQTAYPMLMSIKPVAAQTGQTSEHTIKSRYSMLGAYRVLVTGEGVTGEIIHPEVKKGEKPNLLTMKVRFTIAPGALPGVRDFRIATPQGASTIGQLVIVRDPVIVEQDKNDKAEDAQAVTLPATLCGAIERAEDVDLYKFQVDAGAALNMHVRSMRLQNRIHDLQKHSDPIITVYNAMGSTVAADDNFFFGDPFLSYRFEQAGEYLLEIRDVRFQGNQYWEYSIEVNDRPFITQVFPLGIPRGKETPLQPVGFQIPDGTAFSLKLPTDAPAGLRLLRLPMGDDATNPAPVVVNDLPNTLETQQENNTPEQAQVFTAPAGINGRIESEADTDCYCFAAKKDERFSFEVIARRRQSRLDSHLRILTGKGKQLTLNDDLSRGKRTWSDSWIENWAAPADGNYILEIRDVHLGGGPEFVYYVEVTRSQPYFELYLDTDKTQLTPGTNGMIFARVVRKNGFAGEVALTVSGLPEGVTVTCGRILANARDGCIVLEAAPGTAMTVANITVTGTAAAKEGQPALTAAGEPLQETYMPGGGRGHWPVEMHTVSVGAPADILSVKLSATDVSLKPGESKKIDVTIKRSAGFNKNVTLDLLYRHLSSVYGNSLPQGVTIDAKNSNTLLTGKTSKGHITLTAAANAPPVEKQQTVIMANVSLNFVMKATYASKPLTVTVAK